MLSANSWKAIFALPFNMLITIPAILITFFENHPFCNPIILCSLSLPFFIIGLWLLINTIILFDKKGKGTLAPWHPTKELVTEGPYRYVRNPMICGVIFILIGEAIIFNAESVLILALFFFTINTIYFILKEQPDLEKRFGEQYAEYKNKVPMWIPRLTPYQLQK